ncbi:hypothetical protein GZH53_19420 [Flavihumibacter sp. R14]|nr:hypothetical protein [Flavihumibacter soli]
MTYRNGHAAYGALGNYVSIISTNLSPLRGKSGDDYCPYELQGFIQIF